MDNGFSRHLPNFITCLNLASGCAAMVFVFRDNVPVFSFLVGAALVFDFLDGFVARALKAHSAMGKELDSLADMVTFGLLPGAVMYQLMLKSVPLVLQMDATWVRMIAFFPFIITVFSAIRLARFNIDTRQVNSFLGMPTPAVTIFTVGLALIFKYDRFHLTPVLLNSYVIAGMSMILCFLLVTEIPLFALKFRSFRWADNKAQYLLIAAALVMIFSLGILAIPLIIVFYLILSIINNQFRLNREPYKT